jgi:hypothetical protein
MLRTTHAGTGFMHESFDPDAPINFTRKWFAWANTLFGEFIWKVYREHKNLLDVVSRPPQSAATPPATNTKSAPPPATSKNPLHFLKRKK